MRQRYKMIKDNGGSRSGSERRQFDHTETVPERRFGKERRKGFDRRTGLAQRRDGQSAEDLFPIERRDQFRRKMVDIDNEDLVISSFEALN
jgi:hypothetical protein